MKRSSQLLVLLAALGSVALLLASGRPAAAYPRISKPDGGEGDCPLLGKRSSGFVPGSDALLERRDKKKCQPRGENLADLASVKADLVKLFVTSQDFWPADGGNYGPFFIRLAWHCSGSYRESDGRGGCDGGRIRFLPERAWPDNTNLDKALTLLQPLKLKYGDGLSWGDLIVLAGTTAIESMGGPVLGFCAGRADDESGEDSLVLGPTPQQEEVAKCEVNGNCTFPFGPTTVGLIYVNPEGHLGDANPDGLVPDIRASFGRMGFNDRETVALIGGGHAFGKTHGACPLGAGKSPLEDPANPWPGLCGDGASKGKGPNTFTSGFEGPWTVNPNKWTNRFFINLVNFTWTVFTGPGGHQQWQPSALQPGGPSPPPAIRMLTSDIALIRDASYRAVVQEFAANISALEDEFKRAWYKLVSHDMGPATRCLGPFVPPPQPFQLTVPVLTSGLANFDDVAKAIQPVVNGNPENIALLARFAYQCASTYRHTDHSGGCNGARILQSPEKDLPANKALAAAAGLLSPIKAAFPTGLSMADLIVLAGRTALAAAGVPFAAGDGGGGFRGGRTDVDAATAAARDAAKLAPRTYIADPIVSVRDGWRVRGLSVRQGVALAGGLPRTAALQRALGWSGSFSPNGSAVPLDAGFFVVLLSETWAPSTTVPGEFVAAGKPDVVMTVEDLVILWDPESKAVAQEFAANKDVFLAEFAAAWSYLVNADI
ncbi:putative catalase-peroxidase [Zopfochytrium polystomum]|nr:putative catalase-peroxidase [Zopfochytrium polystomum]